MRKFIIVVVLFFLSCSSKHEKKIVTTYSNGNPKLIFEFVGEHKYFLRSMYLNGNIESEKYYENEKQSGKYIKYFENGSKACEIGYSNGIRNGITREFFQNGIIAFEGNCENGEFEGESRGYFENGKLSFKGNRVKGKRLGWWYFFNQKGDTLKKAYSLENDSTTFFDKKNRKITLEEWSNIIQSE